jgi:acyl carrier protein
MIQSESITLAKINEVFIESGREPLQSLSPEMSLRSDLDLDSLDLAVLTVKLESATGVDVFQNGVVQTVGDLLERLSS